MNTKIIAAAFAAAAGIGLVAATGAMTTEHIPENEVTFVEQVRNSHAADSSLEEYVHTATIADETWKMRPEVQPAGTRIVVFNSKKHFGLSSDVRAVVFKITDGVAIPTHTCLLDRRDLSRKVGKYSRVHPIKDSIDENTTDIHCETPEQAGSEQPKLVIAGIGTGFFNVGKNKYNVSEFGR